MNIRIKKLDSNDIEDFLALIRVFEDVFEMQDFKMPQQSYLQRLLEKDDFFVFVALQDEQVVGGLTSYTLQQYYYEEPLVYIYDLAVKTELQRRGIGRMLVSGLNNYCQEIGVQEVFVQADEEDDHALEFYKSTGGIAEEVVHFTYPLNSTD